MRYRIKSRLCDLNKRQLDLLIELKKRGYKVNSQCELSGFVNGHVTTPKAEMVVEECDKILKEWEGE